MAKQGFFQGKNRDWLFVVFLIGFGAIAMPSTQGEASVFVFPALFAGICFGMALMLMVNLMKGSKEAAVSEKGNG